MYRPVPELEYRDSFQTESKACATVSAPNGAFSGQIGVQEESGKQFA